MITTVAQLNRFAEQVGVKHQGQLLPKLIEHKQLISAPMAKLLTSQPNRLVHPYPC